MKDKRTYTNLKEHGEDMSHENESKIINEARDPLAVTLLTEQYRADLTRFMWSEKWLIR